MTESQEATSESAEATDSAPTRGPASPPDPVETSAAPLELLALNAEGVLGGDVSSEFEAGEAGVLSPVFIGDLHESGVLVYFVVRNNTDVAASHIDASVVVRDGEGALAGTGRIMGTTPAQVPPGGLAVGNMYFSSGFVGEMLPEGADFEIDFSWEPADTSRHNTADLRVTEITETANGLIGIATNESDTAVKGPASVTLVCFNDAGEPVDGGGNHSPDRDAIEPGGIASFSIGGSGDCSNYLVGVSGFYE